MSAQAQAVELDLGFAAVPPMPTKFCKGRVSEVGEAKVSEYSPGFLQWPITIDGYGAAPRQWYYLELAPAWLHLKEDGKPFSPAADINFESKEETNKHNRLWNKNVYAKDSVSALYAFCGCDQSVLQALITDLRAIPAPPVTKVGGEEVVQIEEFARQVTDTLRNHIIGNDFGYTLVQKTTPGGTYVDEKTGKERTQFIPTNKYKIGDSYYNTGDAFFDVNNEKTVEALRRKCAKEGNEGRYQFLVDEEVAF
jgi:hypothetical protein